MSKKKTTHAMSDDKSYSANLLCAMHQCHLCFIASQPVTHKAARDVLHQLIRQLHPTSPACGCY